MTIFWVPFLTYIILIHRFNLLFVRNSLCLLLLCYHIWMDSFLLLIYKDSSIIVCMHAVCLCGGQCTGMQVPTEASRGCHICCSWGYRWLWTICKNAGNQTQTLCERSMLTTSLFSKSHSIYFWLPFLSVLKPLWRTFKWQILWYLIIHFNKLDNWYFHLHFLLPVFLSKYSSPYCFPSTGL